MRDILVKNLYKSYGDHIIFENFSSSFMAGRFNIILGPSGSGKTSLLNMIMGLESLDQGSIEGLDGTISAIFQENRLLENFTVYENLTYVAHDLTRDDLDRYLEEVLLEGFGDKKVVNLSGGMKRRVSILRALVKKSDFYIFDEPFKDMDDGTYMKVLDFVKRELQGETVIFSTHRRTEVNFFNGNIIEI